MEEVKFRLKKVKLEVLIRIQCNIAGKYPIFLKIKKMDITGYNLNAPLSHTEYSVIFLKIKTIFILIMNQGSSSLLQLVL